MKLKTLDIATFNLYNLNEPGIPLYTDRDGWTAEEYARKIKWTSEQLAWLQADVIGFQELWHKVSLMAVAEAGGLVDEYDVVAPDGLVGLLEKP